MPRRSPIPDAVWQEAVKKIYDEKLTEPAIVEWLKSRGFPEVSIMAVSRAKDRLWPQVITNAKQIEFKSAPAQNLPEYMVDDLNKLDYGINTMNTYIEDAQKDLVPFSEQADPVKRSHDMAAREHMRKCFETMGKLLDIKTRLFSEKRTIIQTLNINNRMSPESIEREKKDAYQAGMQDAKDYFIKEMCGTCRKGVGKVIEAQFTIEEKKKEKKDAESAPQKGT